MSKCYEDRLSRFETVSSYLRRAKFAWSDGVQLSDRNNVFIADLYTVMTAIWFDVSIFPDLLNLRWVAHLCAKPVLEVVDALKSIDYALISEQFADYASFKRWLKQRLPGYGQVLAPLSGNLQQFYHCQGNIAQLRTALRFMTRANCPDPIDGLERDAFAKWCEVCLADWTPVDTTEEEAALREIFPRSKAVVQLDHFTGRFGLGAAPHRIGRSLASKYEAFQYDGLLRYAAIRTDHLPEEMPRRVPNDWRLRTGELMFVPKWLDKLRTVNKEHPALMYYELGTQSWMLNRIRNTRWSRHIDLERADLNGLLAELGAITGEYATIDLSDASDRVRYDLVKQMFRGTALREALTSFRSKQTKYKGQILFPTYFAPMGSGLCFPVMCMVIASAVDVIARRRKCSRAWRVYGDDVVVPTELFEEVCDRLECLGLAVNREKSFGNKDFAFRESCGEDFFGCENARPVYVSRFWKGLPRYHHDYATTVESNVALANRLRDLPFARSIVVKELLAVRPGVMFDFDGRCGIASDSPTNYRLRTRYDSDLQTWEYFHFATRSARGQSQESQEDIRLYEWLREASSNPQRTLPIECSIGLAPLPVARAEWGSPAPGWWPPS